MESFGQEEIFALGDILKPIAIFCILPIMVAWFIIRKMMNDANSRTKIVLAAMEKNPEMDISELIKNMSPKNNLLKERLLTKLLWGSVIMFVGLGFIIFGLVIDANGGATPKDLMFFYGIGFIASSVGIAFLINYYVGKKMLAKEIEAEERQLSQQA
ncbi:MAG: hypothetical protein IKD25_05370 [Bacteroidaceae bacterium]|nr:hypothetical protein [Bacteroidaceae bacterium]